MKKNLKSILAMTLASTLILSLSSTTVYASEGLSTNVSEIGVVKDVLLYYDSTYFLFEDGTLWVSDGQGNFVKVYENVKNILMGDWGDLYLILEDDTLLAGNFYYNGDAIENQFQEVATDVKFVAASYDDLYIIKNDDSLWYASLSSNNSTSSGVAYLFGPSTTESNTEITEVATTEQNTVSTDVTPTFTSVVSKEIPEPDYNYEFIKVAENIKDVQTVNNVTFIIDNDDLLSIHLKDKGDVITPENIGTFLPIMENAVDVQLNYNTVVILDSENNAYTLDAYETLALLEDNSSENLEPTLVSTDVESIEITNNGYFLIKEDDTLWSAGSNTNRDLGFDANYSEELIKIDNDVEAVYNDCSSRTIYLKEDGSYWGMGDNYSKSLGDVPYVEANYFDEDGKRFIMDDVSDMFLTNNHSVITKTDGSLWKLGTDTFMELPEEPELTKIADDVLFASGDNTGIKYVVGENKDLYFDDYQYISVEDLQKIYLDVLKSLGYDIEIEDNFQDIFIEMNVEEMNEYQVAFEAYMKENFENIPVASGVEFAEDLYYIDTDNNLYKINATGDDELIQENVIDVSFGQESAYIINTDKELLSASIYDTETFTVDVTFDEYMLTEKNEGGSISSISAQEEYDENGAVYTTITEFRFKESLDFIPTGITNVEDVQASPFEFGVLDLDGTLNIYREQYQWDLLEDNTAETVKSGDKTYILDSTFEDVISFDTDFSNTAFVNSKNELWAMGSNNSNNIADIEIYGSFITEPIKVLDNVEKVSVGSSDTLILTTDNKLYGMGQNAMGELGFKPQGHTNRKITVYDPTKLTLNFIVE